MSFKEITIKYLRSKLREISNSDPVSFFNENEVVGIRKFLNLVEKGLEAKKHD